MGFPGGSVVKNLPAMLELQGVMGLIPGSGRSSGGGHGNLFQYSWLENPTDWGTWKTTVHGVAKIWTLLKWFGMAGASSEKRKWVLNIHINIFAWIQSLIRNGMQRKNHRYTPKSPWIFPTRIRSIQFGLGASIALASLSFIHAKLGFIRLTNYFLYLCKAAKWISLLFANTFNT